MLSFSLPVHKNWWLSLCKLSFEAGSFVNSGEFSYFCVYRLQVYLSQTMQRGCGFRLYWRLAVWKNDVSWWGDHEDIASCRSGNVITFEWAVWLSACAAVYKLSLHVHIFLWLCSQSKCPGLLYSLGKVPFESEFGYFSLKKV